MMDSPDLSTAEQIVQTVEEANGGAPPGDVVVSETPAMSVDKPVQRRVRPPRTAGLYNQAIISHTVQLGIQEVGRNLVGILLEKIRRTIEGTCIAEGFVKPRSLVLLTYSSGKASGSNVMFNAVFQCLICRPVEGMLIHGCVVQNITKAGIRATTKETPSPVVVFVARDHHSDSNVFEDSSVGDIITVKVAGQRYELRDTSISVVGTVVSGSSKPSFAFRGK